MNDFSESNGSFIAERLRRSVVELIEACVEETPCLANEQAMLSEVQLSAMLGMAEASFAGTLLIFGNSESITSLCDQRNVDPMDWSGELVNQLAGRLKNKLVGSGVEPSLGVPAVVAGQVMGNSSKRLRQESLIASFRTSELGIRFSYRLDPEICLNEPNGDQCLVEGELQMF